MTTKPPTDLPETRDFLHRELVRNMVVKSCLNCISFNPESEKCLEFNQRPPAHVVVYGCSSWDQDIPF